MNNFYKKIRIIDFESPDIDKYEIIEIIKNFIHLSTEQNKNINKSYLILSEDDKYTLLLIFHLYEKKDELVLEIEDIDFYSEKMPMRIFDKIGDFDLRKKKFENKNLQIKKYEKQ